MSKHGDFEGILCPAVLKINLKLVWKYGVNDTESQDFSHENLRQVTLYMVDRINLNSIMQNKQRYQKCNLYIRYAAYRSMALWQQ